MKSSNYAFFKEGVKKAKFLIVKGKSNVYTLMIYKRAKDHHHMQITFVYEDGVYVLIRANSSIISISGKINMITEVSRVAAGHIKGNIAALNSYFSTLYFSTGFSTTDEGEALLALNLLIELILKKGKVYGKASKLRKEHKLRYEGSAQSKLSK